jgi:hypothetical protein
MHKFVVVLRFDDVYKQVKYFSEIFACNKRIANYYVFSVSSDKY